MTLYVGVIGSPGKVVADDDGAASAIVSGSILIRITVSRCAGCGLSTLSIVRGTYLSKCFDSSDKGEEIDGDIDDRGEVNEEADKRIEGTRD